MATLFEEVKANAAELKEFFTKRWEEIVPIVAENAELYGLLTGYKNKLELELALVDKFMSSGEFDKAIANLGFAQRNYGSFFVIAQGEWLKAKHPDRLKKIIEFEDIKKAPPITSP